LNRNCLYRFRSFLALQVVAVRLLTPRDREPTRARSGLSGRQ